MDTRYIIKGKTLTDIANSIREREGSVDAILVKEYASRISKIEPSTEEYMRISDYLDYPELINENNYTEKEVAKCQALINLYTEKEDITNG